MIAADTVVIAAGAASYNPLEPVAQELNISYKVVGDAAVVALAFDAIHQGHKAGMEI